jgi:DnaJ-class molecular chaperone
MATKSDYYDILGVSKTATAAQIKSSYRKLALQWHPDRNKSPEAEAKFKEINEAYQILSDTKKRQTYDQFGHSAFSAGQSAPGWDPFTGASQGGSPFSYYYSSGGGASPFGDFSGFADPFEIFEQFFGGASPFSHRGPSKPHYSLRVSFLSAANGGTETVEIDGKKRTIKIPAGADTGTRLRFSDFDITFEVEPDSRFHRDGSDIHVDREISLTQAILGGQTSVPTLEGDLDVKIRPGTQPGSTIRLSGRGVPRLSSLRSSDRGHLYVHLIVKIPDRLSRRQKELLEEFEKA